MATVTFLPDLGHRAWRVYERELRATLIRAGADRDMLAYVLGALEPVFLSSYAEPPTKGDPEAPTLADVNQWVRGQVDALLLALLYREIELFQLRGDTSTLPVSPPRA
jgi:hypothetical protein